MRKGDLAGNASFEGGSTSHTQNVRGAAAQARFRETEIHASFREDTMRTTKCA